MAAGLVAPAHGQMYEKLSPFTEVRIDNDTVTVTYLDESYELVSVSDVLTSNLLDFCREHYKARWQETFATKLVEVLTRMEKRPGKDLVVKNGTQVLLAALKGRSNVTLVGQPARGATTGAGNVDLANTELQLSLSPYVRFEPDGKMLEGKGVAPDILVEPVPEYFIGKRDNVLEEAMKLLGLRGNEH